LNVECSYDNNGNLTSITPPDGGTVSYVFDGVMPSSLASNRSSTIAYVDNNNDGKPDVITRTVTKNGLIATTVNDVVAGTRTITTPAGRTAAVNYDVTNLLTLSSVTPGLAATSYGYDARGRLISTSTGAGTIRNEGYWGQKDIGVRSCNTTLSW